MAYNFNMKLQEGEYTILIDTDEHYGYFEHDIRGDNSAGGLWFEGNVLIDYDGTFALPGDVFTSLNNHGFIVSEDFK